MQWGMDHDARIGMARIISMTMQDEKKVQVGITVAVVVVTSFARSIYHLVELGDLLFTLFIRLNWTRSLSSEGYESEIDHYKKNILSPSFFETKR